MSNSRGQRYGVVRVQRNPCARAVAPEAFYVLEGEYLMFTEGRVVSETPGRKLNVFAPAAMVGFFEALARPEAEGTATAELLDRIAQEHDMEVLGPVPDSYL